MSVVSLLQGLAIRQIRFRFDGQPINETDTPAQVRYYAIFTIMFSLYPKVMLFLHDGNTLEKPITIRENSETFT